MLLAVSLCLFALVGRAADPVRVSVADFGAMGDGRSFSTELIQKAIDHVAQSGGGTVVIPEGVFTTGALFLKPGVNLHLEKNAVLRGSARIEDYPKTMTRIEGHFEEWRPALINATACDNLRISGEGTLEGSGPAYWQEFWRALNANPQTKNLDVPRPRLMFIADSRNVQITGISLRDSGFWNLHLYRCQQVLIDHLDIRSTIGAPSTDGIDIDSSQDVTVRNTYIAVDDDCIAIKGSKGPHALEDKDSPPVERIRIEGCTFGLGHGVVTLGSEATIVRNVVVENCRVIGPGGPRRTSVVRFKLRPDTPQQYEDIHFNNIKLEGFGRLFSIESWTQYFDLKGQQPPTSIVRNISVSNVTGSFEGFGTIRGHDKTQISDIRLENINLKLTNERLRLGPVENLVMKNVIINGKPYEQSEAR